MIRCFNHLSFLLFQPQGIGSPSVYHAVIVIFLEFFAWGLLTAPTLVVSDPQELLLAVWEVGQLLQRH